MKGKIIEYTSQEEKGLIAAQDGNRYIFTNSEWKSDDTPKVNQIVDFELNDSEPLNIYLNYSGVANPIEHNEDHSGIMFSSDQTDSLTEKAKVLEAKVVDRARKITRYALANGIKNKPGFFTSYILLLILAWHSANNSIFGTVTISIIIYIMISVTIYTMLMFALENREKILFGVSITFVLLLMYVVVSLASQDSIMKTYEIHSYIDSFFGFAPAAAIVSLSPLFMFSSAETISNAMVLNMIILPAIMLVVLGISFMIGYKIKQEEHEEEVLSKKISSDHYKKIGISIGILTFLFGFIGTLFSRYIIAEEPLSKSLIPTAAHIAMGALLFIPQLGWLVFLCAVSFMAYLNIQASIDHIKATINFAD